MNKSISRLMGGTLVAALVFTSGIAPSLAAGGAATSRPSEVVNRAERTLSSVGVGNASALPDIAQIMVSYNYTDSTIAAARDGNRAFVKQIRDELGKLGIRGRDISGTFSISPYYGGPIVSEPREGGGGDTPTNNVNIYQNLNIRVRNINNVPKVVEKLADILGSAPDKVNSSNTNVTYALESKNAAIMRARTQAISDARRNAEALAAGFGLEIGELLSVSESFTDQYAYSIVLGDLGSAPNNSELIEVSPDPVGVTVNISVAFRIK